MPMSTENPSTANVYTRKSDEEYQARRAEQLAHQTRSLDIIEDVAAYLDNFLKTSESYKVIMKDILNHLNNKYTMEETKVVSQHNYLMMDLANARKNRNMTSDRVNIRIMYIQERFKTSYFPELHARVAKIIETYSTLFAWNCGYIGNKNQKSATEKKSE